MRLPFAGRNADLLVRRHGPGILDWPQPRGRKTPRSAKVGELPVAYPSRFELVVDLKTAKALDIAFPTALLMRANEVIE